MEMLAVRVRPFADASLDHREIAVLNPDGPLCVLERGGFGLWEEAFVSDRNGRVLIAIALFAIATTLTVGTLQLLMRLEVLR
jgi:hypothetical protein